MNDAPIGVFDSGLGGLTVARAIMDKLPGEDLIYLGDTANTPYGPKSIADVRALTIRCLDALVDQGVKMLVIACNTGTAAALSDAQERYWARQGIPVVEVITPAATAAAATTRNGKVGVIGTQATISSGEYRRVLSVNPRLEITQQACPRFVDFVEQGITTGEELTDLTRQYLAPLQEEEVDTVVLGCTHYPLLTGVISYVMGPDVSLVASSEATANAVYSRLVNLDLLHGPGGGRYTFLSTSESARFTQLAKRFLGPEVESVHMLEVNA